ncbi:unnamed protein product [Polarella glacialis]|uniref:MOSC domain-containing protein n=1 Tax=Polarella glacialis TaxID=89957 RepID=A0A813IFE3_POLGL|nr:unnamed protein product [Polarella glacialis]
MDLPEVTATVESVWEQHPSDSAHCGPLGEPPVHFVRRRTHQRKSVRAIGLEDSREWHRDNCVHHLLFGEPWDRALLVGSRQHYHDLQEQFPEMRHYWEAPEATFGEQLVVDGLDADKACLGDILQSTFGPLKLQITCPRLSCFRVDHRYPAIPPATTKATTTATTIPQVRTGQPGSIRHYAASTGRAGFFCRVLCEGSIWQGDTLKLVQRPRPEFPLSRLAKLCYSESPLRIAFAGSDQELNKQQ